MSMNPRATVSNLLADSTFQLCPAYGTEVITPLSFPDSLCYLAVVSVLAALPEGEVWLMPTDPPPVIQLLLQVD